MECIHVRINEEGTLRNQRYAFGNRFTLITELLQNGRRAGATVIEISHDPASQTLRVIDDGHGIDDFSKLLIFNESGWDEAVQAEEHPFGAGFSRCLYASTRCIVTSRGKRIDFDTASALSKAPIAVEEIGDDRIPGTRIELHGVDLPDLESRIEDLCKGFAVPIEFNGKPVARPHALGELCSVSTPIGDIHLAGAHSGRFASTIEVYLQGLRVMKLPNYVHFKSEVPDVVHLDSKEFLARLPDRDILIDADVQAHKIREHIRMAWRDTLVLRKAQLTPSEFVADFFKVMDHHKHLDLLNDVDALPRSLCRRVIQYPVQSLDLRLPYVQQLPQTLLRKQIEDGQFKLVKLSSLNGDNCAKWMLARAKGYIIFDSDHVDAQHWIHQHILDMGEQTIEVEATGIVKTPTLETNWISAKVVLCHEVTVRMGCTAVSITDEGFYHEGMLYIPRGENSGKAVEQCSLYMGSDELFREGDRDADVAALERLIHNLRMTDPVKAMRSLLRDSQSTLYPCLYGKSFRIRVEQDPDLHVVELIA